MKQQSDRNTIEVLNDDGSWKQVRMFELAQGQTFRMVSPEGNIFSHPISANENWVATSSPFISTGGTPEIAKGTWSIVALSEEEYPLWRDWKDPSEEVAAVEGSV